MGGRLGGFDFRGSSRSYGSGKLDIRPAVSFSFFFVLSSFLLYVSAVGSAKLNKLKYAASLGLYFFFLIFVHFCPDISGYADII